MQKEILIIGGGASGFMAAIVSARNGYNVKIVERNDRVLKKLLTTGNGRCNFTNINITKNNYYGKDNSFVEYAINKFTPKSAISFFEEIGVMHTIEENGKVYPLSLQASSVVDALRFEADKLKINLITGFDVNNIRKNKGFFEIISSKNKILTSNKIIVATGGKSYFKPVSDYVTFEILKKMGHKITNLNPALVQLKAYKNDIKGLEGIKVNCKIKAFNKDTFISESEGELLFTNYGISGPVVFDLSYLTALYDDILFAVDFLPYFNKDDLFEIINRRKDTLSHFSMENFFNGMINKKLGQFLTKKSGIEKLSLSVADLTNKHIKNLISNLKEYNIKISGTTGFENAQVTAGGVCTNQINRMTMESTIADNLYLAGEVIDIFGDCGGYNLQWAWSSGYIAGLSASTL